MEILKILVLDDEERFREEISEYLQKRSYEIYLAEKPSVAFSILEANPIDIVILDIKLPEMNGLEVLKIIKSKHSEIEVIMISGHGDMNSVIESMRYGASDYFQKPFRLVEVNQAIQRTQKFIFLNRQLQQSKRTISILTEKLYQNLGSPMIGSSESILEVMDMMQRVASSDLTSVLITGESGTGKELVAHGIHLLSNRNNQVFHSVNCSAITDSLFESEFFGHKKGSYTGAFDDRPGWFEVASKGTLFLDEIGDMPLGQQAKLLRTLEDRKIRRVGSHQVIDVDVRVIAASNQNLEKMSDENKFRGDLYHRLSTFIIHLPPLRERSEDIPLLADHFLQSFASRLNKKNMSISEEAQLMLKKYSFPGNIRELRNIIERALILCDGEILHLQHFPTFRNSNHDGKNGMLRKEFDLEVSEKRIIEEALEASGYNKSKAASLLNITWQSLNRRMKKFDIEDTLNQP
ncbi:MAG: DNA-binding response regulator [Bacteroidetes bacterium HGW-Bacteroidetes-1]|jgi:DNA-binding NtrC family response regulator|nr:MAG: DNA-binding response regulator [Bacteroidetes bacterium HGW-Bacteroidetes-1]